MPYHNSGMVHPNDSTVNYDVYPHWHPWPEGAECVALHCLLPDVPGGCVLICLVAVEHSLHEPMYLFLSMLAFWDLFYPYPQYPKS